MRGYWNDPEETAEAFRDGSFVRKISAVRTLLDIFTSWTWPYVRWMHFRPPMPVCFAVRHWSMAHDPVRIACFSAPNPGGLGGRMQRSTSGLLKPP